MIGLSLTEVLHNLGYAHGKDDCDLLQQRHQIYRDGFYIGSMASWECWSWLRETGELDMGGYYIGNLSMPDARMLGFEVKHGR